MDIPEIVVDSPQALLSSLDRLKGMFNLLWFRGQPLTKLPLVPCVHREMFGRAHDERFLVHTFRLLAPSRYERCPPMKDYASWLFLMQHYGLPTRLLDWTASPLVASFFAVQDRRSDPYAYDDEPEECEVYALDPSILNHYELLRLQEKKEISQYDDKALKRYFAKVSIEMEWIDPWGEREFGHVFEAPFRETIQSRPDDEKSDKENVILAVRPVEMDLRVGSQSSRFTVHGRSTPLDQHPFASKMLCRFRVPGKHRKPFQLALLRMNVCRAALFHDLDNLSEDLARYGISMDQYARPPR